ncbi:MAG: hypothetical protein ABL926_03850 [Novosphingobium sp.]|uniref:hypothetical protein n=1 Tax=Novosphingobium sp. TaxID=1874826 RepID=UPI0032B85060
MNRSIVGAGLVIGAVLFAVLAVGAARAAAAKPAIALVCTVQPGIGAKGGLETAGLCEIFRLRIEAITGTPVRLAAATPKGTRARWITLDIRAPRRNALEARMTSMLSGRRIGHTPIAIDVMDKAIGRRDVDSLAQVVAKQLVVR